MLSNLKNNIIIALLVFLFILLCTLYVKNQRLERFKKEKEDYNNLYEETKENFKSWKDKNNQNHFSTGLIALNSQRVFDHVVKQETLLHDLQTKLTKLEGYRIQASKEHYYFHANLRDSIIHDSIHIQVFSQADPKGYYLFNGEISGDSVTATLSAVDTLVTGISKGKRTKKFLIFRYGPRPYKVEIVNKNPFVETTYNKEIYLKKD